MFIEFTLVFTTPSRLFTHDVYRNLSRMRLRPDGMNWLIWNNKIVNYKSKFMPYKANYLITIIFNAGPLRAKRKTVDLSSLESMP
jgi:hypothetical protein